MAGMNALQSALLLLVLAASFMGVRGGDVLLQGYQLMTGKSLVHSPYELRMQSDCNLVLYKYGSQALWTSNTYNKGRNCYFVMENDGNGVIYTSAHKAIFYTNTNNRNDGDHYLIVQGDGNAVMYNGDGKAIWATGTSGRMNVPKLDGRTLLLHAKPGGILADADHN